MDALGRLFSCYFLAFAFLLIVTCEGSVLFGQKGLLGGISSPSTAAPPAKPAAKDQANSGGTSNATTLILANRTVEDKAYESCKSVGGAAGHCRHLRHCLIDEFVDKPKVVDEFSCTIETKYIGICCPDDKKSAKPTPAPSASAESVKKVDGRIMYGLPKRQKAPAVISQKSPLGPPGQNRGCGVNALENSAPTTSSGKTDSGEYPWMAAVVRASDGEQFCGGVLMDQWHILTAAHCFRSVQLDDIFVVLGEYDLTDPGETRSQLRNVSRLTSHLEYDAATYENDIAILRLEKPAIFNAYVWPVCLPEEDDMKDIVNKTAIVTGWGLMYDGGPASTVLLEVAIPVWTNEQCQEQFSQVILDTALCAAAYQGGKDSCRGDSGGPMMIQKKDGRWTNIGIVSFGISCGQAMQPGVYTRVTKYLPWIQKYTQQE